LIYEIVNYLRDKYKTDAEFKRTIDNLNIKTLQKNIKWLFDEKDKNEPSSPEERMFFENFFDNDLILTIKDRLQAPTYHGFNFSEKQIRGWYEEAGYSNIKRITRYTKGFRNLRRFLAPMYYHYDHPLSRFFFGEGYIQVVGVKGV